MVRSPPLEVRGWGRWALAVAGRAPSGAVAGTPGIVGTFAVLDSGAQPSDTMAGRIVVRIGVVAGIVGEVVGIERVVAGTGVGPVGRRVGVVVVVEVAAAPARVVARGPAPSA